MAAKNVLPSFSQEMISTNFGAFEVNARSPARYFTMPAYTCRDRYGFAISIGAAVQMILLFPTFLRTAHGLSV